MSVGTATINGGTSATPAVAVTGAGASAIVLLLVSTDDGSAVIQTADWPAGFVGLDTSTMTFDGQVAGVGWKRLTGTDTGSYTFGNLGASSDWLCHALPLTGRHATDPPVISTRATGNATSSPVNVAANGVTALDGDDLVWICAPDVNLTGSGNGTTPPSGYTEATDQEGTFTNLSIAYKENVAAGATGTVTGQFAFTASTDWTGWLIRVPIAVGAPSVILSPLQLTGPAYAVTRAGSF